MDRLTVEPRSWAQIWFRSGIVQDYVVFPAVHGFVHLECNGVVDRLTVENQDPGLKSGSGRELFRTM